MPKVRIVVAILMIALLVGISGNGLAQKKKKKRTQKSPELSLSKTIWDVRVTDETQRQFKDTFIFDDALFMTNRLKDCSPVPFKQRRKKRTVRFKTAHL